MPYKPLEMSASHLGNNKKDVAMKEYVDALVASLRLEMQQREEAAGHALQLAAVSLNQRLESMNEFRNQIASERAEYVRAETFRWAVGALLGVIGLMTAVVGLWVRH